MARNEMGVVRISGKVQDVTNVPKSDDRDGFFITLVKSAAPDEYSHPQTFCIFSEDMIGSKNDVVEVDCRLTTRSRRTGNKTFYQHGLSFLRKAA